MKSRIPGPLKFCALALLVGFNLAATSCGGDDDVSGDQTTDPVASLIAPIADRLSFEVVLPTYLPDRVRKTPTALPYGSGDWVDVGISMFFPTLDDEEDPGPDVNIIAGPPQTARDLPTLPSPFAPPTQELTEIAGHAVRVDRSEPATTLFADLADVTISVRVDWQDPPSPSATEDEARKVLEPMLH